MANKPDKQAKKPPKPGVTPGPGMPNPSAKPGVKKPEPGKPSK